MPGQPTHHLNLPGDAQSLAGKDQVEVMNAVSSGDSPGIGAVKASNTIQSLPSRHLMKGDANSLRRRSRLRDPQNLAWPNDIAIPKLVDRADGVGIDSIQPTN